MPRILFIDDEPINQQLVARALEPLNCELFFAENGTNGIAQARALLPDAIITDVMMPDITGYELTRILRRETQFSSTPILILTAQSGLQDKLQSFEAGADDHLTKPFEASELAARVMAMPTCCSKLIVRLCASLSPSCKWVIMDSAICLPMVMVGFSELMGS